MSYDSNNIFAKILRGEIPCHKVHEDEDVLAFMDIMPRSNGHCLVISKAPARNLLDIEPAALAKVIDVELAVPRLREIQAVLAEGR